MDRHVPPRVTYWTGIWRPGLEAISNELVTLRAALAPGAPVVSFSQGQSSAVLPAERAIRLSGERTWMLKALAATIEATGDVTHAWGAIDDWHFLRSLGRRPTVFTVVLPGPAQPGTSYTNVDVFAAETEPLARALVDAGVPPERVRIVFPGVDLNVFRAAPAPDRRFRLIFASSPSNPHEFEARGIHLLVDIARACPDIDVVLLWREWGDEAGTTTAFDALEAPRNVVREARGTRTMSEVYQSGHAVVCLYGDGFGKSCPNSVVEGLACGRPALVSEHCGIAALVADARAGLSVKLTTDACIDAVRRLQADWARHSQCARTLAVRRFGVDAFVSTYREIYGDLAARLR